MGKIKRRDFLRTGLMAGGAIFMAKRLAGSDILAEHLIGKGLPEDEKPDILSISGAEPEQSISRLLEALGGIGKYVHKGQQVGLLVNSPWKNPGYFTNPDIVLAVASLCLEAGASEIVCYKPVPDGYWEKGSLYNKFKDTAERIRYGDERTEAEIPKGKTLKKAEIFKDFMETDVFISIPVAKHHAGMNFSGNLKGLMGVSSSATNRHMHSPDDKYTYEEVDYLAQCIADLNLLRKPDLCIVDATICGQNNGPSGPGKTIRPDKIVAGTDPLAVDVYCAKLIEIPAADVPVFAKAYDHGLGEIDLNKLSIHEL